MKYLFVFFVVIASLLGLSHGTICARDRRSGGPQNFDNRGAMDTENRRGGREFNALKFTINFL